MGPMMKMEKPEAGAGDIEGVARRVTRMEIWSWGSGRGLDRCWCDRESFFLEGGSEGG